MRKHSLINIFKEAKMIKGRVKFLDEWSDWDDSLHEDEKQIERQGWAMNYPFTFEIDKDNRCGKFSSTTLVPYYETHLDSCTCNDFLERQKPCKHIYRLAVELGLIEIIKRQSGGYDKKKLDGIKNSDDIDSQPDQLKRQKSALKCKIIEFDKENKRAIFKGSGKDPYETTMDSCTCRDFVVRDLPCKHIYRLRMEFENPNISNEIQEFESTHFDKEYAKDVFKDFSESAAYDFIYVLGYDWLSSKKLEHDDFKELEKSALVNTSSDLKVTLNFLTKKELTNICDDHEIPYKSNTLKSELVKYVIEGLDTESVEKLSRDVPRAIRRDPRVGEVFGSVKHFYHKLYPWGPQF